MKKLASAAICGQLWWELLFWWMTGVPDPCWRGGIDPGPICEEIICRDGNIMTWLSLRRPLSYTASKARFHGCGLSRETTHSSMFHGLFYLGHRSVSFSSSLRLRGMPTTFWRRETDSALKPSVLPKPPFEARGVDEIMKLKKVCSAAAEISSTTATSPPPPDVPGTDATSVSIQDKLEGLRPNCIRAWLEFRVSWLRGRWRLFFGDLWQTCD